ncbi:MAG TPA: hypothetical protein VFF60_04755 [Candidatus Binatus sp.]|nr:hypothetical protein [Candidatus Binatus sp.]
MTVTGLSVFAALGIGALELGSVLGRMSGASSGILIDLRQLDFGSIGLGLVALFLLTWLLAAACGASATSSTAPTP